jgi:hypothetical protein
MAQDIQSLVSEFASRIDELVRTDVERRVREILDGVLVGGKGARGKAGRISLAGAPKKKSAPSPGRQLQGQYIGALRSLKGQARARVKATAKRDGVEAALKLAQKLRPAAKA